MQMKINYRILSLILIFVSFSSLFLGFYLDENSAGAGSYNGDIRTIWNNLQIFLTNDLISSINHPDYFDSRTPIAYVFHEVFNPFVDNITSYRRSVFIISLILPVLFYFCLKQKFTNNDNILLLLISSTVCLSPYFRTSSYWGLEENFGLIFLLLTFMSLSKFLKSEKQDGSKIHLLLFATTFFSSCCLYFDQKLIIIPTICFITIIKSNKLLKLKLFSIFYYFLLSLPYIYLIILWGGLIPTASIESRKLGSEIFLDHIGFTSTMIAFYLLPLLLFRNESIKDLIKNSFLNKRNYFLLSLFIIYIFYMIVFYDLNEQLTPGKGFINKISLMFFNENLLKSIFIYVSFFISWIIILIYIENKLIDVLTIVYLFILSIFLWPIHQEYFDPLILLMAFTFFNSKMILDYKNSTILFIYLFILLISSNIYYTNLLN
tara:strand:+ start:317 stop:1615 length:1299 start_codon:yes stop_codon:yes gene_type:complete